MLSLMSAEGSKLLRHKATWFLVWGYAIAIAVAILISIIVQLLGGQQDMEEPHFEDASQWAAESAVLWQIVLNTFGRYLVAAYAAVAFAGEYGWNTWKLIVPHRPRPALLASKYAVVFALVMLGFALAGLVTTGFQWLEDSLTGDAIPAGITLGLLAEAHWLGFLAAVMPVLLTIAYASLAAILTRSMVAALVISIVLATVEQIFLGLAPAIHASAPALVSALVDWMPGYHLANLAEWIGSGAGKPLELPGQEGAHAWSRSLAVTAGWTALLAGLTFWRFGRQDIN